MSYKQPQPPKPRISSHFQKDSQATNPSKQPPVTTKPTLFAKYNALSFKVKLYLWVSTAAVAWLADSVSDKIFEQNMIDAEAERRVEIELKKLHEQKINEMNLRK